MEALMSEDELIQIEGRYQLATSGPWKSFIEGRDHDSGADFIRTGDEDIYLSGASRADQDFVAHARQDVPALIVEVRRLQALVG
jgi:hypothetical protein